MESSPGYDLLIVGGGPAGASCAAFCARAGVRVLVVERANFPRDKVCGDCLNPDAWPTLARLGLEERVLRLPHIALRGVEFVGRGGSTVALPLPARARGEIAVRRRVLDALLLENAGEAGAAVRQGIAVSGVRREDSDDGGWTVTLANGETVRTRLLVAADGRNSVAARLAGLLDAPPDRRPAARIGLQTHLPCPADFGLVVRMRWFARGYGGLAPVGDGELNISLAGPPGTLDELKEWARREFALSANHPWRTIAPLDRAPAPLAASADGGAYLVGDAARVVEPFTGEGIYYALRSGELAAASLVATVRGEELPAHAAARYRREHRRMYRGRLWVNRLARLAGRNPRLAGWLLEAARWHPGWLRFLTAKVASPRGRARV